MATWRTLKDQIKSDMAVVLYYQPPETLKMTYPCVRMKCDRFSNIHGDNSKYLKKVTYLFTYITRQVDDPVIHKFADYPGMTYVNNYTSDGLYHWTFSFTQIEELI